MDMTKFANGLLNDVAKASIAKCCWVRDDETGQYKTDCGSIESHIGNFFECPVCKREIDNPDMHEILTFDRTAPDGEEEA